MVVLLADGDDGIEPYEVRMRAKFSGLKHMYQDCFNAGDWLQVVTGEDKIMYSDDPPMMFPEFQWERDSTWMVATVHS